MHDFELRRKEWKYLSTERRVKIGILFCKVHYLNFIDKCIIDISNKVEVQYQMYVIIVIVKCKWTLFIALS